MKVLAHIREQYRLSLGSYGRPRMTMELREAGLDVGERRVGRLMRINGIKPVRTRKHKVTTDSHRRLGVAANWLDGDFAAHAPTANGPVTSPISGRQKAGSTSPLFSTCMAVASLAGLSATG
ncbi:transposase [Sphingobium xenophagum]|uniref:Transposase n=1 Tax=Sphingobium xenophagum TaxID=121428 RepID=A0A401J317_SPHXE|nr:transposase [Sphingobium xenophagum]